jgi:two-component system, OmpR family, response regulator
MGPPPQINGDSSSGEAGFATYLAKRPDEPTAYELMVTDMSRILVVEDDPQTADEISAALADHGFAVDCAATGREGVLRAAADAYDAIVLDRMLPGGMDGLGVLAAQRAAGVEAPVLILSALSAVDERVRGLRAGGDDYMTKPFDFLELTARLDILLRRNSGPQR